MLGEKPGFTPERATNVMCLMCLVALAGLTFKTYCGVRYIGYGDDECYKRSGERIFRLGEMAGALLRKLFMSSASSAIGTGTVLGMHSALSPAEAPSIQGDLREAHVDESKNWLKVDFSGASTFFFIALVISICLIIAITIPCCCGCTPHKLKRKKEEEEWKKEVRKLMDQRKEDVEYGLEAEGWTEINKGKGPRLVDPSGV